MKNYSLLFLIFLIISCSNKWEEQGFSENQEQEAKEMGFENPIDYQHALDFGINTNTEFIAFRQKVHQSGFVNFSDYKEALDLEITNFDDLKFYRDGGFKDKEQFKLAQRFRLDSLDELKEFNQHNCAQTQTYEEVCTYHEMFDDQEPRLEYHLTKINQSIDASEISTAVDCKNAIPSPKGHYRTVFIKVDNDLIPSQQKKWLNNKLTPYRAYNKYEKATNFNGLVHMTDSIAIIFNNGYERERCTVTQDLRAIGGSRYACLASDIEKYPSYTAIMGGYWRSDENYHYFISDARKRKYDAFTFRMNRKTGLGYLDKELSSLSHSDTLQCKAFSGDVKSFLKNDVFADAAIETIRQETKEETIKFMVSLIKEMNREELIGISSSISIKIFSHYSNEEIAERIIKRIKKLDYEKFQEIYGKMKADEDEKEKINKMDNKF